jgi:hypothetical protein
MVFGHMFVVPNHVPPGRFFLRTLGRCVYGGDAAQQLDGAARYVREVLETGKHAFEPYEFLLGEVRGDMDDHVKVLDVFGFKKDGDWAHGDPASWRHGDPEVSVYTVRNGLVSRIKPRIRLTTLRVIGEELHRRSVTAGGLPWYLGISPPEIPSVIENATTSVLD